jgi:hypothetical protein
MSKRSFVLIGGSLALLSLGVIERVGSKIYAEDIQQEHPTSDVARRNADKMIAEGRQTFRFDTFGDEAFWGNMLRLHEAVEGAKFGGAGPGLRPRAALALGLKVDVNSLPRQLVHQIARGEVNLDDPGITLALLQLKAVVGLTGFFNESGSLRSLGIQCALCHSTVDDSLTAGIGRRRDGWANRDLNVGAIVSLSQPDARREFTGH